MDWIQHFDLFLFDFDGLLVNTEPLHYQAYRSSLAQRGCVLDWSFMQFCSFAHQSDTSLREALVLQFPQLEGDWDALYAEKKKAYAELVISGKIEWMPGVESLLLRLAQEDKRRVVVTHSSDQQVRLIRSQMPTLQTLPHWVTREDYQNPKPYPDGYLKAMALYGKSGDRMVGFEDSYRGIQALQQTPILPVWVCFADHPLLSAVGEGVRHFSSFEKISSEAFG